jgi:Transglutaminase-like superfamily
LKSLVETWTRFWRLTGLERGIVMEAAAALLTTWLGLRLAGFRRWNLLLSRLTPPVGSPPQASSSLLSLAQLIARLESAAARNLFYRPSCLERSMVLCWLLRARGIPAELRVGAHKEAERFEAHAWVQCADTVLNQPDDLHIHFVPFDGPISSAETASH